MTRGEKLQGNKSSGQNGERLREVEESCRVLLRIDGEGNGRV